MLEFNKKLRDFLHFAHKSIYIYIYRSKDFVWESMRFHQMVHPLQKEFKYSQMPH